VFEFTSCAFGVNTGVIVKVGVIVDVGTIGVIVTVFVIVGLALGIKQAS
jgi:hypothetical protein